MMGRIRWTPRCISSAASGVGLHLRRHRRCCTASSCSGISGCGNGRCFGGANRTSRCGLIPGPTRLRSMPMPSTSICTTSPGCRYRAGNPLRIASPIDPPPIVPEAITSAGTMRLSCEARSIMAPNVFLIYQVLPSMHNSPLTRTLQSTWRAPWRRAQALQLRSLALSRPRDGSAAAAGARTRAG